ncbi:ras-induced vulval development antagonist-domain-containing protein, partial [Catenaria anguillulae PL171]
SAAAESSDNNDDDVIGPTLPTSAGAKALDTRSYGKALLAGEGSAMAAFVQEGKRIPRRGEIGLKGEKIEEYEAVGYVMSGSRHQRMNAVRLRKENQVISAEERRKLLLMKAEEKTKKEAVIMSDFKELVDRKIKKAHAG